MAKRICQEATHCWGCDSREAEVARLQTALEGAEAEARVARTETVEAINQTRSHNRRMGVLRDERDGYKALAKLRGEALEFYADETNWAVNEDSCQCGEPARNCYCPAPANDDGAHARAAIDATPAEREKEPCKTCGNERTGRDELWIEDEQGVSRPCPTCTPDEAREKEARS